MTRPPILPRDVAPDALDDPFWAGCCRKEFLVHRCEVCGRAYWPASCCIEHGAAAMAWHVASGRGRVHTYTVFHHPYDPAFKDRLPYVIAVVELDEGPFFHTDIVDCEPDDVYVDLPVEVVYETVDADTVIPRFRPAFRPEGEPER
jgi:uncharacterized OB-fold protein